MGLVRTNWKTIIITILRRTLILVTCKRTPILMLIFECHTSINPAAFPSNQRCWFSNYGDATFCWRTWSISVSNRCASKFRCARTIRMVTNHNKWKIAPKKAINGMKSEDIAHRLWHHRMPGISARLLISPFYIIRARTRIYWLICFLREFQPFQIHLFTAPFRFNRAFLRPLVQRSKRSDPWKYVSPTLSE